MDDISKTSIKFKLTQPFSDCKTYTEFMSYISLVKGYITVTHSDSSGVSKGLYVVVSAVWSKRKFIDVRGNGLWFDISNKKWFTEV